MLLGRCHRSHAGCGCSRGVVGLSLPQGEPRTFSSGACGWYLGGKVELKIGSADVWAQARAPSPRHGCRKRRARIRHGLLTVPIIRAQVGMNVVIPGSNVWKK